MTTPMKGWWRTETGLWYRQRGDAYEDRQDPAEWRELAYLPNAHPCPSCDGMVPGLAGRCDQCGQVSLEGVAEHAEQTAATVTPLLDILSWRIPANLESARKHPKMKTYYVRVARLQNTWLRTERARLRSLGLEMPRTLPVTPRAMAQVHPLTPLMAALGPDPDPDPAPIEPPKPRDVPSTFPPGTFAQSSMFD